MTKFDSLKSFAYAFGYLLELLGCELEVRVCKAHVGLALHGHEVDMSMGHLQAEHTLSDLDAGDGLLYCLCHLLGKHLESCQFVVLEVEYVIHFTLGNHEGMSLLQGADVEEGIVALVLSNLVARYLAGYNTGKDGGHVVW